MSTTSRGPGATARTADEPTAPAKLNSASSAPVMISGRTP